MDIDLTAKEVHDRLVAVRTLSLKAEDVRPSAGPPHYIIYRMGNPAVEVEACSVRWPAPASGEDPLIQWSGEVEGARVPRRVELSFTARRSDYNENERTAFRVFSWLVRNVPGNYFLAHESGSPYMYHLDGQTWVFEDEGSWNAERGWPEDWGVSVPYRFRRADMPVPDPLPPLRNTGAAG